VFIVGFQQTVTNVCKEFTAEGGKRLKVLLVRRL